MTRVEDAVLPPYRTLTSAPVDQPDERRRGIVRLEAGQPFKHFCQVCGRWGAFSYGCDFLKSIPAVWYCGEHRAEGERRWKASA